MEDYFEQEIKQLNQEILYLKTSVQRSAGAVPIISKTITVEIPLVLKGDIIYTCSGRVDYVITPDGDSPIMATLDRYFDDITKATTSPPQTRQANVILGGRTDERIALVVTAQGDRNDVATLQGVGSVTLSYQLTIRAMNDFIIERL